MEWIEIQRWKLFCSIKEILSVCVCNMVFLHHLPSQMLTKQQPARRWIKWRIQKKRALSRFFLFLCSIINGRYAKGQGTLIPSAVDTFSIKIKGGKSFVYTLFSCLDHEWISSMIFNYRHLEWLLCLICDLKFCFIGNLYLLGSISESHRRKAPEIFVIPPYCKD